MKRLSSCLLSSARSAIRPGATLLGVIWLFAACAADTDRPDQVPPADQSAVAVQQDTVVEMDVPGFERALSGRPGILLDVRTPAEYAAGHIAGSRLVDFFSDGFEDTIKSLSRDQPVYVYCAVGGRSGEAAAMMKEWGFGEVYNLSGGFTAWKAQDKPEVSAD